MRILFVAKHAQANSNDDEGSVSFALRELGHEVIEIHERNGRDALGIKADWCLFFKWEDTATLSGLKMPAVFYYFDLVNFPDPTLAARCQSRIAWMRRTLPHVALGFCTDGDYVARHPAKLIHLTQGADERTLGRGTPSPDGPLLLFTGISRGGGQGRVDFVESMQARYGSDMLHVRHGIHGREMADLIATAKIVVAPDSPVTDRYYSNRVYNVLGFGGFLLHPYSIFLTKHYQDGREIVYYRNREELHELIAYYADRPHEREAIAEAGLQRTRAEHTYRHRCEHLLRIVHERLQL